MFNPLTREDRIIPVGQMVGAIVPRNSGGIMAAMQNGFFSLDLDKEEFTFIADPESGISTNRFNDGKRDPVGRFWAGTMDLSEASPAGSHYRLDHNLQYQKVLNNVTVSNSLAWDVECKTMYYIDTPTKTVAAFDFDIEKGEIHNKRVVIQIPDGEGFLDGMTIDEEGMLWVAQWEGYQVSRWNPNTGEKIDSVRLPVSRITRWVRLFMDSFYDKVSEVDVCYGYF